MAITRNTVTGWGSGEVIERARAAREAERVAAFAQLEMVLAWAWLHPCPAGERPAQWGETDLHGEGLVPLAGPGAPWVAEFAPADLGAALGITLDTARQLLGDVLELAHRLPRLYDLVSQGRVAVWRARLIARETTDLSPEAARFADRLIAATPQKIGLVNATRLVQEARLFFDPDRAVADEETALARRGVWTRHGAAPATTEVSMTLDTADALLFDSTVGRIAHDLGGLGDTDDLDVRRARAVGILADPQHALDLMSGHENPAPTPHARVGPWAGCANLYLHLTPADLTQLGSDHDTDGGVGAVSIEGLGAVTTTLLTDWLARFAATETKITLRPVLHLRGDQSRQSHRVDQSSSAGTRVDRHDPPAAMREVVVLRDAHCVFPACRRDSRSCDLDHITAYLPTGEGGPPGQTHPDNLAPLCRAHHRVKTHTAWDYTRDDNGTYTWTSPTGHQYDTTPTPRLPPHRLAAHRPPRRT